MSVQLSRAEELKRKRDYWKRHIESWHASGFPQRQYCRHHNLIYHQFVYWKKRFVETEAETKFVPLDLGEHTGRPSRSAPLLRLIVANRYTIEIDRGFDPHLLRQLIIALGGLQ